MVSRVLGDGASVTRVFLHTFGCKANQYDTELVRQALEAAGATAVEDPDSADVAVVNSCTVTHVSEAKMRGFVRRVAAKNRRIRTVVMGCAAALDDGRIASLPGVQSVVPGADAGPVLNALGLTVPAIRGLQRGFAHSARAWLKIQDGCDEHCTFCATTLARGENRSRAPDEIVDEASRLAEVHEEIVLTGVHIGTYGRDRTDGETLGGLVERLVREVPRVRFRLSSVEATEIEQRLVDVMASAPDRLAPHVHAPLQSGSDAVLKRMGRHWYTARGYGERLRRLVDAVPMLGLGADVMVGFPGETDGDFEATRQLIESLPYTYAHVFPYSERNGAPARHLGPPTDPRTTQARSRELRDLVSRKRRAYHETRDGGEADVVLLRHRGGRYEGLTGDYLPVSIATDRDVSRRFAATLRHTGTDLVAEPRPRS